MFTFRLQVENPPVTAQWKDPWVTGGSALGSRTTRRTAAAGLAIAVLLVFAAPSLAAGASQSTKPASPGKSSSSNGKGSSTPRPAATSANGVVQSVGASAFFVRQLDGTTVSVPFGKKTQLFVDGRHGRVTDVKPGYVLVHASWKAGSPARMLRFVRPS